MSTGPPDDAAALGCPESIAGRSGPAAAAESHLPVSAVTRAAAGGFQLGIGLVLVSLGRQAETERERRKMYRLSACFLAPAAANLAFGYWYSAIARSGG